jgi:4-hydroxy-tetrahydrodipicolinate synthase
VYGAPEWPRSPRLPLIGAERDFVIATVQGAIDGLASYAHR